MAGEHGYGRPWSRPRVAFAGGCHMPWPCTSLAVCILLSFVKAVHAPTSSARFSSSHLLFPPHLQYPHELELLFPPLTGMEVVDMRVEKKVLVVQVPPAISMSIPPSYPSLSIPLLGVWLDPRDPRDPLTRHAVGPGRYVMMLDRRRRVCQSTPSTR